MSTTDAYDYFVCHYNLPDGFDACGSKVFRTTTFDNEHDAYALRADGHLILNGADLSYTGIVEFADHIWEPWRQYRVEFRAGRLVGGVQCLYIPQITADRKNGRYHYTRRPKRDFGSKHVVLVTDRWTSWIPNGELSHAAWMLWWPLEHSKMATQSRIHYDELGYQGVNPDEYLLKVVRDEQPDLVLITWGGAYTPSLDTVREIHNRGVKVAVVVWDGVGMAYLPCLSDTDLILPLDCPATVRQRFPVGFSIPIWTPLDTRVFHPRRIERDIPLSFIGSVGTDPMRSDAIRILRERGVDLYVNGGQRENKLSIDDYATLLSRSQMTLGFCRGGGPRAPQCKGRVFEALLSGAFLLEEANDETAYWFRDGVDLVMWTDVNDLLEKVEYYAARPELREKIARHGYRTCRERHTGVTFWREVFGRLWPS